MGRLTPGTTPAQVQGNLDGVLRAAAQSALASFLDSLTEEERGGARNRNRGAELRLLVDSGRQGLYDASPRSSGQALILGVVVTLVLLIVCANVATLLLSRAVSRQREVAIRMSVGATRGRLIRQLVTESLLVSAAGGMLALPVAWAARRLLPFGQTNPFDWRVFAFAGGLSLAAGVAFSLVPSGEFGVRMALGASSTGIAWLVLRESLVLVAAGVAAGVGTVLLAGRLVASLIHGLAPTDPVTILQAAALLAGIAAAAAYLPARRAARVDPLTALQDE